MAQISFTTRKFQAASVAIIILGFLLRIVAARGDLWQDEITSLGLARAAHSAGAVFLLAYDNNHFLNTLFLYLIGPDCAPVILRSLSIVLGTLTIFAAGRHRAGGTGLVAMGVFALSFPMINYGAEARGYAGLILCTVLAIDALDRGRRYQLALAIGCGLLFHLSMASALAALMLADVMHRRQLKETVTFFLPSLWAALAVALVVALGIHYSDGYHFGSLTPFSASGFVAGYGGMINAMIGLPEQASPFWGMAAAVIAAVLCFAWQKPGDKRPAIFIAFLVCLPVAVFLFHVPNAGIRRYYTGSAAAFLLCVAELAGQAWRRGKAARMIVALAAFFFIALEIYGFAQFIRVGRGQYSDIVALMTATGPTSYAGEDKEVSVPIELNFYAQKKGADLSYVFEKDSCAAVPQFFVVETPLGWPNQPPIRYWGVPGCTHLFGDARIFEGWGISGAKLTLYRKIDQNGGRDRD